MHLCCEDLFCWFVFKKCVTLRKRKKHKTNKTSTALTLQLDASRIGCCLAIAELDQY